MATKLRAVTAADAPVPVRAHTVAEAAESGTHRDLLVAIRKRIAGTVSDPSCPPRDLAALTRRLQDIAREIEAIDLRAKQESGDGSDDLQDEVFDSSAV